MGSVALCAEGVRHVGRISVKIMSAPDGFRGCLGHAYANSYPMHAGRQSIEIGGNAHRGPYSEVRVNLETTCMVCKFGPRRIRQAAPLRRRPITATHAPNASLAPCGGWGVATAKPSNAPRDPPRYVAPSPATGPFRGSTRPGVAVRRRPQGVAAPLRP